MKHWLKKRYTWLGIIAIIVCLLSHFKLIDLATSMYIVGTMLGWFWGYDYCKERMEQVFDAMCQDCGCDSPNDEPINTEQK